MRRSISSEAFVLSAKPYSEADKIITVFSKDFGKLSLMAKGVRKLKSKKRGTLEPFSRFRFIAHTGHGMPIVTETEMIDGYSKIRKDLARVSVAYFLMEVVMRSTQEEESITEVYDLLAEYLKDLETRKNLKNLRREFSLKLMEILGFIPEGQFVPKPDEMLEHIIERKLGSVRVGKKLQM